MVTCGFVAWWVASHLDRVRRVMDTLVYRVPLVRVIHYYPGVLSDVLLAQRARRRCGAIVEILVQASSSTSYEWQPGTCVLGIYACLRFRVGYHGGCLPWCLMHSVAIRVTSSENIQLTRVRRALHLC